MVTTSGVILGTWTTTTTSKTVEIEWSYTTGLTGVQFVLDPSPSDGVTWTGPASISILSIDVIDGNIGIQAFFSGSTGLAASQSSIVTLAI